MNEAQKTAIQCNWVYLLKNVDLDGYLLDHLFEQKTISKDQKDRVMAEKTAKDKVAELLNILQRRSPNAFNEFLSALRNANQQHIAQQLEQAFQPQQ